MARTTFTATPLGTHVLPCVAGLRGQPSSQPLQRIIDGRAGLRNELVQTRVDTARRTAMPLSKLGQSQPFAHTFDKLSLLLFTPGTATP
ncbi:hypothetical protein ACWDBO_27275 [Streptomyces mirabilis]|uniref:hypothetical protein n=1 Tax=Streptomyces TaxID=1883 RepID=UPI000EB2C6A8|nr:hypothetical protein [Streptomyces sp. AK02-04a]MDX3759386.1 hypothetical protein [Streptomyces sp. AK02-04a]